MNKGDIIERVLPSEPVTPPSALLSRSGHRPGVIAALASLVLFAAPTLAQEATDTPSGETISLAEIAVAPPLELDFPYISIPDGYRYWSHHNADYGLERFPFWAGDRYEWVEGKYSVRRIRAPRDRDWSDFEVNRHYEAYFADIGAVQISEGQGNRDLRDEVFTDYIRSQFRRGLEDCDTSQRTWVIRQADRTVWMQLCGSANWIVGETEDIPAPQAAVTPEVTMEMTTVPPVEIRSAAELEQTLTEAGRVDVPGIFFEFDSASLLPESQDALEQMAALLSGSDIAVTIAGHTDNQGDHDYNMTLSEQRAQAVRQALIDQHAIDGGRLTAVGFGFTEPVASNDSEAGRAQNRRVELVASP